MRVSSFQDSGLPTTAFCAKYSVILENNGKLHSTIALTQRKSFFFCHASHFRQEDVWNWTIYLTTWTCRHWTFIFGFGPRLKWDFQTVGGLVAGGRCQENGMVQVEWSLCSSSHRAILDPFLPNCGISLSTFDLWSSSSLRTWNWYPVASPDDRTLEVRLNWESWDLI